MRRRGHRRDHRRPDACRPRRCRDRAAHARAGLRRGRVSQARLAERARRVTAAAAPGSCPQCSPFTSPAPRARCPSSRSASSRSARDTASARPEVNVSIEGYLCDFVWREQRVDRRDRRAAGLTARRRRWRRDPVRGRRSPDRRLARDAHHLDAVVRDEPEPVGGDSSRAPRYAGACSARRTASIVTIPRSTPSPSTAMIAPSRARPSWPSRRLERLLERDAQAARAVVAGHHRCRPSGPSRGPRRHALDRLPGHDAHEPARSSPPPGTTASRSAGSTRARRRPRARPRGSPPAPRPSRPPPGCARSGPRTTALASARSCRAREEEADEARARCRRHRLPRARNR